MYHAVDEECEPTERRHCVKPTAFDRQMACLRDEGYRPVSLAAVVEALAHNQALPGKVVSVTFDDGFADVRRHALPILERHAIPATLFAVTRYLGGVNEWMDRSVFPSRRIMSAMELRDVQAAGVEIGSHTVSHPSMVELSLEEAGREAMESKTTLEQLLGRPVRYFAYPYGRFNLTAKNAVHAAGYRAACSTRSGFNSPSTDVYELRRLDIFGHDSIAHFKRKLAFGANDVNVSQILNYFANRALQRLH
jgi:peptidoglycan/xylan/chitin deacetylase (PgdA/CDA1 family)